MARFTRKIGGKRHKRAGMSHKKKMGGKKHHKSKKHHKKHHKKHGKKGSMSKTRHGRKNFVTHKGSKVFNRKGHYQYGYPMPYKGMRM